MFARARSLSRAQNEDVTRRALAVSVLGVAAPICLLAAAWVADRMFHHHHTDCVLSRVATDTVVEVEIISAVDSDVEPDVEANAVPPELTVLTLPELRRRLLTERHFYGWETSTPDLPEILYAQDQFPQHQMLMSRIEQVSGRPLRDVIRLSPAERLQLRHDAAGCDGWRAATWLLHELDGAPLPRTARNRAKRIACEGAWLPGDP
jgi:hypothetical protein